MMFHLKINYALACFLCLAATALSSSVAFSQEVLPDSVQPGRVEQEFKVLRVPKSNAKAFIPGQRDLIAPQGSENVTFVLNKIDFEGVTALDEEMLSDEFQHFFGQKISLVDLYSIANRTTAVYRNKGFVLSQAVVPEQEINNQGVVTIRVVEGFINHVTILGVDTEREQQRILKIANKIRQSRPLQAKELERYLLILNDYGGVDFSATLSPSDALGAADMQLNVTKTKLSASLNLENRGTDIIGPERLTGQLGFNGVFGGFNSNDLTVITTGNDELGFASIKQY